MSVNIYNNSQDQTKHISNYINTDDIVERLFAKGLILPPKTKRHLALWYYYNEGTFTKDILEERRKLCSYLFKVGYNVINDPTYFYLNIDQVPHLVDEFPNVSFETVDYINQFANTTTFYPIEDRSQVIGEDILGNNYDDPTTGLIFLRICPGDPLGSCDFYSVEELIATFLKYDNFIDPHSKTNQTFSDLEIKRLDKLLSYIFRNAETYQTEQAGALMDVIDLINKGLLRRSKLIETIGEYILEKEGMAREFFEKLLHIGMKMRGWSGNGKFPLESKDTSGEVKYDLLQDEILVYRSELDSHFSKFSELPIFVYKNGKFKMSIDTKSGFTIAERIDIVLKNEDNNACIRISSNWIVSTVWYYVNRFLNESPFPINDLQCIS